MKQGVLGDHSSADRPTIALLSIHLDGHRRSYVDLFQKICADAGLTPLLLRSWKAGAEECAPLLVLMIEESFVGFVMTVLRRAVRGRPTTGLLFGGAGLVNGSGIKADVKRWGLRLLTKVPHVTVLAITPFEIVPGLEELADDWIYDPQLWDLGAVRPVSSPLADDVRRVAAGRTVVTALGRQSVEKGFDRFTAVWTSNAELRSRCLFVSAGDIQPDLQAPAEAFVEAGGYVVDRFITDDELMSLYGASDMVWALYAPAYDQSSGVFGRALQWGRPAVVRRGSQIHDLARYLETPVVDAPWDDDAGIVDAILSPVDQPAGESGAPDGLKSRTLEILGRHVLAGATPSPDQPAPIAPQPAGRG